MGKKPSSADEKAAKIANFKWNDMVMARLDAEGLVMPGEKKRG